MIIRKVYIEKFGKLRNFSLDFKEKLNIVYGENEVGKTTIMNFIIQMFYGSNSRSKNLNSNQRLKYIPWNEEYSKGYIEFNHHDINYRLTRVFRSTKKGDEISLINADTGENILIPNLDCPGEHFLKMSESAFRSLQFISTEMPSLGDDMSKTEISERLLNLVSSGIEDISYRKAMNHLDEKIYGFESKSRNKGIIPELNKNLEILNNEYEKAINVENKKMESLRSVNNLESELHDLETKLQDFKRMAELSDEKVNINIEILLEQDRVQKNRHKKQLESGIDEINEKIEHLKKEKLINTKINYFPIVILLMSLFLVFLSKYYFIFSLGIFIYFVFDYFSKKNKDSRRRILLESEISKLEVAKFEKKDYLSKIFADADETDFKNVDYLKIQEKRILDSLKKYENIHGRYQKTLHEDLENRVKILNDKLISEKTFSIARYKLEKSSSTIKNEIYDVKREVAEIKNELNIYIEAKKEIERTYKIMETDFSPRINLIAGKIISNITEGKYDSLLVSKDFEIAFKDSKSGDIREYRYLSASTVEQFYLALKIAIITLISPKENRIILLDDIFVRFDKNRFQRSLEMFLKEDYNQVIYFTCHENFDTFKSFSNIVYLSS